AAFIVLATARLEVHQVLRDDPPLRHERVAKPARIRNHVLALTRTRVDPNAQRQLGRQRVDLAENYAVIPPYRWRQDRQLAERARVAQPQVQREQAAERGPAHRGVFDAGKCAVGAVDEGFELLDEHAAVLVGMTAAALVWTR